MSFVKSVRWSVKQLASHRSLVALGLVLNAGLAAHAVPLAPGGVVFPAGTTAAARPELGGVVIYDVVRPFSIPDGLGGILARGWVQDRVVRSAITGRLHFYYRVQNDWASKAAVHYIRRASFSNHATDVDYRLDGPGLIGVRRVFRSGAPGAVLTFDYTPRPILPGEQSRFTFAATRALQFDPYGMLVVTAHHPVLGYRSTSLRAAQPI
jgi:hypothetical protein